MDCSPGRIALSSALGLPPMGRSVSGANSTGEFKLGMYLSDTTWNLAELETYVRGVASGDGEALEIIRSIDRGVQIFRYHMVTGRDALNGIVNTDEPHGEQNLMLVLGASANQEEFAYAKIVSEANLIGCIYTARSLLDIFSHLINRLVLRSSLPVRDCDIRSATKALPKCELKGKLEALISSPWFGYVSAFVNTAKHRQLVQHTMSISFKENVAGIRIGAFQYGSTEYPACWANEFLQGVIDIKNSVVVCGCTLNRMLLRSDA
jgi:hypothetical protein